MRTSVSDTPLQTAPLSPFTTGQTPLVQGPYATTSPIPGSTSPSANVPTIGGMLNALKRRWVLASFIGILVAAAAAVVTWVSMPSGKHLARAVLLMSRPATGSDEAHRVFKDNQYQQLKNRTIINLVLSNKDLADLPSLREVDDKARFIEESIETKWVGDDTLKVSMNGNNPEDLKLILDKLVKAVIDSANSRELQIRGQRMKQLQNLQDKLSREIDSYRKELKENAQGISGVVPADDGNQQQLQTYQNIEAGLVDRMNTLDVRRMAADIQHKRIGEDLAKPSPPVPNEVIQKFLRQDTRVKRAAETFDQRSDSFKKVQGTFDPSSEIYKNTARELAEAEKEYKAVQAQVMPEIEKFAQDEYKKELLVKQADLAREIEQTGNEKESAKVQLERISGQIQTMMARVVENQTIRDKIRPLNDKLTKIKEERIDLENQPQGEQRITIFDDATVYLNQNLKQRAIASAAVAIAGFFGILALVAYLEWRTRRVDSVDQVMNELGMRVIGTIPAFPSKAAVKSGSAEANQNWRFILNESVNSTRTLLLHTAKTQSMQVIMVTSAMQGEGKTSLASQLATSMATAGLRTLILDCDMRNPSVHRLFDVALTPGCSEILCQEVDVSDAVQQTSVPNLWMIPAGQCSNRVIAALAQGHPLETLFNRLRGQFDFIVVDCCPVLPVADALLIGQHVDGVVFSILQDISQLPKVIDASKRLTSLNIPLLGAVVNGTKVDMHTYGYNYVKQLPA